MKLTTPHALAAVATAAVLVVAPAASASACTHHHHHHHGVKFSWANVNDNLNGTYTLSWDAPGAKKATVYTGDDRNHLTNKVATCSTGTCSVTVKVKSKGIRQWFKINPSSAEGDSITVADRLVRLANNQHIRDIGGYETDEGEWVQMGREFRAGDISGFNADDVAQLKALGITADVDLRSDNERASRPDPSWKGLTYVVAPMLPESDDAAGVTNEASAVNHMKALYGTLATSGQSRLAYSTAYKTIASEKGAVLIHSSEGVHRVGVAVALLLKALGVSDCDVLSDYLWSNVTESDWINTQMASLPASSSADYRAAAKAVLEARPEYLSAAWTQLASTFGSFNQGANNVFSFSDSQWDKLQDKMIDPDSDIKDTNGISQGGHGC